MTASENSLGLSGSYDPLGRAHPLERDAALAARSGSYARALALQEEACRLLEAAGRSDDEYLAALTRLGRLQQDVGHDDAAEELFRRVLTRRQERLQQTNTAESLTDLAGVLRVRGDIREAESLLRLALHALGNVGTPEDRLRYAACLLALSQLPQVRSHLDEALRHVSTAHEIRATLLGPDDAATAVARRALGEIHQMRGEMADAECHLVAALSVHERAHGPDHPVTATSQTALAALYRATRRYAEAERLYRASLRTREAVFGPEDTHTAQSLNSLGLLLRNTGHVTEAEPLIRRALDARRVALGEWHPATLQSLSNYTRLLHDLERWDEAAAAYDQFLAVCEALLGRDHPDYAHGLHFRGTLRIARGDLTTAERDLRQALEIRQRTLGADHPDTAQTLAELGSVLYRRGQTAAAEPLLRRADATYRTRFGVAHPFRVRVVTTLAAVCSARGDDVQAEALLREVVSSAERDGPSEGENLARVYADLAWLRFPRMRVGDLSETRSLFERARNLWAATRGTDSLEYAGALDGLARVLRETAPTDSLQLDEAERLSLTALEIRRRRSGRDSSEVAQSLFQLSVLAGSRRRWEEAERFARESWEMASRTLGRDAPASLHALFQLAISLRGCGRVEEAQRAYRLALDEYRRRFGGGHPATAGAANGLALALLERPDADRSREANQLARLALAIRTKALGSTHPHTIQSLSLLGRVLQADGRPREAVEVFRQLLSGCEKVYGEDHRYTALNRYFHAVSLRESGDLKQAREEAARAVADLRASLREGDPDRERAERLLAELGSRS